MDDARNLARHDAWSLVSDRVMGGVSDGTLRVEEVRGRRALRLRGRVRLENGGGFVQMARDLGDDGEGIDFGAFAGLELDVLGNGAAYNLHLRTDAVEKPWQSYRASFDAPRTWTTHRLPFAAFEAHRIEAPFDPSALRRIGLVAIGRAFDADLALARMAFF